jgi:hypothetical protein
MFILQLRSKLLVSTLFIQVSAVRAELYQGVCGETEIPRVKTHNTETVNSTAPWNK